MKVRVRGLTFDVAVEGPEGGAPVLLLHGFPEHSIMWDRVAPTLHANGWRTIAMDQRGYSPGARPSTVEDYAIGECVADAIAVLDELGVETADLVGHDWGSIVGWHLASTRPDRFRTFTAVSVPHPVAFGAAVETDEDQQRRSAYVKLFRQPGKAEDVLLENGAARITAMFDGCPRDRVEEYVAPMRDRETLTATLNWYRAMHRDTMACPEVEVPVTFVWGDADIAVGATAARSCAAYCTGEYRFVSLVGVGHWVADEAPGALSEAIVARLES
jgi:pimeloyl-ACP methyl ester carboxylesterase